MRKAPGAASVTARRIEGVAERRLATPGRNRPAGVHGRTPDLARLIGPPCGFFRFRFASCHRRLRAAAGAARTWRLSLSPSSPSPMTRDVRPRGTAAPLARRARPAQKHGEAVPAAPQRVRVTHNGKAAWKQADGERRGICVPHRSRLCGAGPVRRSDSGLRISTCDRGPGVSSNVDSRETVGAGPRRADEPPSIRDCQRPCPRERVRPGPETA